MDAELWATIRRLFEVEKLSRSAIATRLGLHRWTVRRALSSTEGPPKDRRRKHKTPNLLDPYRVYLENRIKEYPELSGTKLLFEIKRLGYSGGGTILRDYLSTLRPSSTRQAFLRIETLPGEFAQVDWANLGTITIGNTKRKLSCFVMVLSYSRLLYLELTFSQCLEDFLSCHINAFRFFGGIPRKINYDNLKTVVVSRVGCQIRFHTKFMDFAGYYLFEPIPCGVRQAHEKGKVESAIRYVRSSFLAGRELSSFSELQKDSVAWRDNVANIRFHASTRERPIDRFELEKPHLQILPERDYDTSIIRTVQATHQALVHFESNRYSVPFAFAGRTLTLKAPPHHIHIFDKTRILATHQRCYEKHKVIENPVHYEGLLAERKKARQAKMVESFLKLAPECQQYLDGLVQSELHLPSHLEKIQGMAHLYGKTEVIQAIIHALKFKAFGSSYIQNIILQQRAARNLPQPQPIMLTKKPQWTSLAVEETDLSVYDELFDDDASLQKNPHHG